MTLIPVVFVYNTCLFEHKVGCSEFGAYMFSRVMSSPFVVPLTRMKCPLLSLLISFHLKPVLSEVRIVTTFLPGPICLGYFLLSFVFKVSLKFLINNSKLVFLL